MWAGDSRYVAELQGRCLEDRTVHGSTGLGLGISATVMGEQGNGVQLCHLEGDEKDDEGRVDALE